MRFVEHADHLADVGLLVTLGHEALLVEHGVDLSTREVVGWYEMTRCYQVTNYLHTSYYQVTTNSLLPGYCSLLTY